MSAIVEPLQRIIAAISASADTESPIDALFVPSAAENVPRLVSMLRFHKLDPTRIKLLVTSGWDNSSALREPVMQGANLTREWDLSVVDGQRIVLFDFDDFSAVAAGGNSGLIRHGRPQQQLTIGCKYEKYCDN